jgi:hypothetical protein
MEGNDTVTERQRQLLVGRIQDVIVKYLDELGPRGRFSESELVLDTCLAIVAGAIVNNYQEPEEFAHDVGVQLLHLVEKNMAMTLAE